jgi:hydroxymethylpyrimidine/phosphomethylpyrimidine kinase
LKKRPYIVTIAGLDPSNGAGLTADIKTFETLKCYGLSVCTANTIQNDTDFEACHWMPSDMILEQLHILFKRFQIDYVKIGIVENWNVLSLIVDELLELNPKIKIVLDPVLSSSSNFDFHNSNTEILDKLLSKIYMLTPNYNEIKQLYPELELQDAIKYISSKTNLFLKGGHHPDKLGKDELFTLNGHGYHLNPKLSDCTEKHGSGCVLSSAITSYLALGFPLLKASYRGKRYTEKFLSSNKSLLGFHSKK